MIFSHVKRLGNRVAHTLPCQAREFEVYQAWLKEVPNDVEPLVLHGLM